MIEIVASEKASRQIKLKDAVITAYHFTRMDGAAQRLFEMMNIDFEETCVDIDGSKVCFNLATNKAI